MRTDGAGPFRRAMDELAPHCEHCSERVLRATSARANDLPRSVWFVKCGEGTGANVCPGGGATGRAATALPGGAVGPAGAAGGGVSQLHRCSCPRPDPFWPPLWAAGDGLHGATKEEDSQRPDISYVPPFDFSVAAERLRVRPPRFKLRDSIRAAAACAARLTRARRSYHET